jgi:hydrogenase nickel incorporation protein HypB
MCQACGCGDSNLVPVALNERILAANDRAARHNREHFRDKAVSAINLMGSPGAGKTAVLEATARALGRDVKVGVLAGDLATDNDARRIRAAGLVAESITTGTACHLDAEMIHKGLHRLPNWRTFDYLFIENVVALSVTEGEDKPLKYPTMFQKADLVLLTKIDLLPQLPEISLSAIRDNLAIVMPVPRLLPVSARTGEGIDRWITWLEGLRVPRPSEHIVGAL